VTGYVGVDLHRRRSVMVVLEGDGTELWSRRIDNDPLALGMEIEQGWPLSGGGSGGDVGVVLGGGCDRPGRVAGCIWRIRWVWRGSRIGGSRMTGSTPACWRICCGWAGWPEWWVPPEWVPHQRELVRYRRKLSQRAGLKAQVHAVLGKEGLVPPMGHLWGPGGKVWLDETNMAEAYERRVRSLRRLIRTYDHELARLDARIAAEFRGHHGYEAIQALNGVGPVLGAVFCAELGDVSRFRSATRSYAAIASSRPVFTSNTNPRIWFLLGMKGFACKRAIDCRTSASASGKASRAKEGLVPSSSVIWSFTWSSRKVSIPQSVWWMRMISLVPNRRWEITSDRIVSSVITPPALRMTWASPSSKPRIR
jgi:hypothetical protein